MRPFSVGFIFPVWFTFDSGFQLFLNDSPLHVWLHHCNVWFTFSYMIHLVMICDSTFSWQRFNLSWIDSPFLLWLKGFTFTVSEGFSCSLKFYVLIHLLCMIHLFMVRFQLFMLWVTFSWKIHLFMKRLTFHLYVSPLSRFTISWIHLLLLWSTFSCTIDLYLSVSLFHV